MILQSIYEYVLQAGRIDQSSLLIHFHLREEGLSALMAPLLKHGKIQKTLHQRGKNLPAVIYYSIPLKTQIPTTSIV